MTAIELLAETVKAMPVLAAFSWKVDGCKACAFADLSPSGFYDARKLFDLLHDAGWKRAGSSYYGTGTWLLHASLERDGAELRVEGMTSVPPDSGNLSAPYFAPPVPPLKRGKKSLTEFQAWEAKCREGSW